ncbi:MAG TPA: ABC transporter permease [Acetobacteraceae bacterium]|nr:ABC transporter permease [Acetobacteraceae bacterium]
MRGSRAYRALLRLYPASFRAAYGAEMCAIFTRRRRDASGPFGVLAIWVDAVLDTLRNAAVVHWDILRQDLRYTVRTLRRSPGFTVAAVLVAALGIGATTAAFSITDHVLFRPLPFKDPDRLVGLWQQESFRGGGRSELSPANYRDWKSASRSFQSVGALWTISKNLSGAGDPARLDGSAVTAEVLPMLGVQPAVGRLFTAAEDRDGAPLTLVLSDRLWRARFAADPNVLGRKVVLNDAPYLVIGVMPRDFHFPTRTADFWTTLQLAPDDFEDRTDTYLQGLARLRPGVSAGQARAELRGVAARLERAFPDENAHITAAVLPLRDLVSEQSRLLLVALLGASLCVLLIACTNLANLLLARGLVRRKELALRTAIGAGHERLVRQMLTESLLLAAVGGVLGTLLAIGAAPLVARLVPTSLPIAEVPGVDPRMLLVSALFTIATGIGFGMIPALRGGRHVDTDSLRDGTRTGSSRRAERLRSTLVVAEVAASVVLLIAAGLLVRAMWRVQAIDPGFRAEGVLTLRTALPLPRYESTERRHRYYSRVVADIRALPGVENAAFISALPMVWRGGIWSVTIAGQAPEVPQDSRQASLRYVTPGFFETVRIPLLRGRDVSDRDTNDTSAVAVVSDSFARLYWPGENPLGRRFDFALQERTIVGVVGDVRVRGLERDGSGRERSSEPQVYLPARQVPDGNIIGYVPKDLAVRSSLPPGALIPALREIIARVDPQQPISDVQPLADIVEAETAPRLTQVRVLGAFAAIAFVLAAVGIHGLLAFTVSSRAREIGVRMALGARAGDVLGMVLLRAALLALAGVALGVPLAFAAGRGLQALLAGVSPADTATLAAAVVLALGMTLAGSLLPALRAVRVDPNTAMRAE